MLNNHPIAARFMLFIATPLLLVGGLSFNYLNAILPGKEQVYTIEGLTQQAIARRDDQGVVYIEAQTDRDAFFTLGFVHAQDRMWQLELQRRIAKGTLSEIFGQSSVGEDAWMRTLGLYGAAKKSWTALDAPAQASLQAYAAGINAWLSNQTALPPEFSLLDINPEPWQPVDSLAWAKVFALNLSGNLWSEVANLVRHQYLTKEQVAWFKNSYASDGPTTVTQAEQTPLPDFSQLLQLQKHLQQQLHLGGEFVGSNAWVIGGQHTKSGHNILANDPHLGLSMPSLWYVASIKGDKLNVSGMTLVGLPIVIFGRNKHIAWGGTNMMADVQDLYLEQVNPENLQQYRYQDRWETFTTRFETIKVKAEFPASLRAPIKPIKIQIRSTRHGPVISDFTGSKALPVALKWTALDNNDTTYQALLKLNYASDWHTFKTALASYVTPTLNMLYSDLKHNIGYLGVGKIPIRGKGEGQKPVPGSSSEYQWLGFIPASEMPQSYNPKKGYIVTANNKVVDDDAYPYFISHDWAQPARAQRISQLIEQQIKQNHLIDVDYMMDMQADTLDTTIQPLLKHLKKFQPISEHHRQALAVLSNWDGNMEQSSQAAALFYVWMRHLRQKLFSDELKAFWNQTQQENMLNNLVRSVSYEKLLLALTTHTLPWCNDINTPKIESCSAILQASLEAGLDELERLQGRDISDWSWGSIHTTVYAHTPFSEVNLLDLIFERRIANGGSPNAINVSNAAYAEADGYEQTAGAGFRQIITMGQNQLEHHYMNSTGQSGYVLSKHYDDMVKPFRDVNYFKLSPPATGKQSMLLTLNPN